MRQRELITNNCTVLACYSDLRLPATLPAAPSDAAGNVSLTYWYLHPSPPRPLALTWPGRRHCSRRTLHGPRVGCAPARGHGHAPWRPGVRPGPGRGCGGGPLRRPQAPGRHQPGSGAVSGPYLGARRRRRRRALHMSRTEQPIFRIRRVGPRCGKLWATTQSPCHALAANTRRFTM